MYSGGGERLRVRVRAITTNQTTTPPKLHLPVELVVDQGVDKAVLRRQREAAEPERRVDDWGAVRREARQAVAVEREHAQGRQVDEVERRLADELVRRQHDFL